MERYFYNYSCISITVCFVLLLTPGQSAANTCSMDELIRNVTVVYNQPGQPVPCEVMYEKPTEGQSMTLWRAQNETGYCEARASEFVAKLESLGWTCVTTQQPESPLEETAE